jgi:hypothetical protein
VLFCNARVVLQCAAENLDVSSSMLIAGSHSSADFILKELVVRSAQDYFIRDERAQCILRCSQAFARRFRRRNDRNLRRRVNQQLVRHTRLACRQAISVDDKCLVRGNGSLAMVWISKPAGRDVEQRHRARLAVNNQDDATAPRVIQIGQLAAKT